MSVEVSSDSRPETGEYDYNTDGHSFLGILRYYMHSIFGMFFTGQDLSVSAFLFFCM